MKQTIMIGLGTGLFIFCLLLPSSSGNETTDEFVEIVKRKGQKVQEKTQAQPIKISFATPLKQVSDYWRRSIDSFKGRMDEIGLKYEITEFSTRVYENRKLKECVQLALETDPDYLILTPNDQGDEMIIARLLNSQDTKIIVQNMTTPDSRWKANPPFMYVGFDHTIGARLIAKEYMNVFKEKEAVKYALLYHVPGNQVSRLRGDFFNEILRAQTDFKLVSEYYTGGNRARAREATLKILSAHPDIDFIHACSTDIAFGALDALKEKQFTNSVMVNGWGGGSNELDSLLAGDLDFTVMRMNDDNGVAMAEAIRLDVESNLKQEPIIYSGEMVIVRQGISKEKIIKLEGKAFRYSGH